MLFYYPELADFVNCFSAVLIACTMLVAGGFAWGSNPVSTSKKVVIYVRYSSDMQRDTSIDDQVRNIRIHLEKLGIPHKDAVVLCDEGISGEREDRESYQIIREMIREEEVSIVACDEISRFFRGSEAGVAAEEMELYGCNFITADGYDLAHDPYGFMATIKGKMAGIANRELAHRTRRGIAGRVLDGNGADGTHPFGYSSRYIDPVAAQRYRGIGPKPFKEVFINEAEAAIVREIFTMYIGGIPMTDIARALNDREIPLGAQSNRRDKNGEVYHSGWHKSLISKMLRQRKYVGIWFWGEFAHRKTRQGKRLIKPADPRDVIKSERPELAIVPQDLWDKVQERLKINKEKLGFKKGQKKRGSQHHHTDVYPSNMLGGLLFCGECGTRMQMVKNQSGIYYRCPNGYRNGKARGAKPCRQLGFVPYDRAVAALTEHVDGELRRCGTWVDDVYQAAVAEYLRLDASLPDELSATEDKLASVNKAIANMLALVEHGSAPDSILERLNEREAERRELESMRESLARRKKRKAELPTVEWVKNQLEKLPDVLAEDPRRSALFFRKFFGKVFGYIVIAPGKKRGHAEIAFKTNRVSAVLDIVGGDIPPSDDTEIAEVEGEEVRVALAGNDKLDKLMPTIDAMRQAGKTWRQIESELEVHRGWANRYYRIWKATIAQGKRIKFREFFVARRYLSLPDFFCSLSRLSGALPGTGNSWRCAV